MPAVATLIAPAHGSTQFIITVDRAEKARWKSAADQSGLSMAEYVRRAVQQVAEAPTPEEIAEARVLAAEVNAAAARMEAMLDRTIARIEAAIDPAAEAKRRAEIYAELEASGQRLDLGLLATAAHT
jgi:hypothetical protein